MRPRGLTRVAVAVAALAAVLAAFGPILWMGLTSFKSEADAFAIPPRVLFEPTLSGWHAALVESPFLARLGSTVMVTSFSTLAAFLLGIPAAYSLAFAPGKRADLVLLWCISTRMLPPVGVIIPLYVLFRRLALIDTTLGLVLIFTAMNLPLVIWMLRSFFLDLPLEVVEAARLEGATPLQELRHVVLPMSLPGLASTALLCFIFAWNEFFFSYNLTVSRAATLSVYLASFKTSEGLFWARMSAAATAAVLPIVVAGWVAQRQLVRGLTMGAVR
jgi:sorbitol/mannitol transport system permease protein